MMWSRLMARCALMQKVRQFLYGGVDQLIGLVGRERVGDQLAGGGDGDFHRLVAHFPGRFGFRLVDAVESLLLAALDQFVEIGCGLAGQALGLGLGLGDDALGFLQRLALLLLVKDQHRLRFVAQALGLGQAVLDLGAALVEALGDAPVNGAGQQDDDDQPGDRDPAFRVLEEARLNGLGGRFGGLGDGNEHQAFPPRLAVTAASTCLSSTLWPVSFSTEARTRSAEISRIWPSASSLAAWIRPSPSLICLASFSPIALLRMSAASAMALALSCMILWAWARDSAKAFS